MPAPSSRTASSPIAASPGSRPLAFDYPVRVTAQLHGSGEGPVARCSLCSAEAVGPCARCRAPVCGDCCELSGGGVTTFAVCTRCAARGGAHLGRAWLGLLGWIGLLVVALGALGALAALGNRGC